MVGGGGGRVGCSAHEMGMFVGHDLSLGAKHTLVLDESVKYRPIE
jgi:hypothetical protein